MHLNLDPTDLIGILIGILVFWAPFLVFPWLRSRADRIEGYQREGFERGPRHKRIAHVQGIYTSVIFSILEAMFMVGIPMTILSLILVIAFHIQSDVWTVGYFIVTGSGIAVVSVKLFIILMKDHNRNRLTNRRIN
ncbi:hypothetical protein ACFL17_06895 [Pseudomonadota bacterium]